MEPEGPFAGRTHGSDAVSKGGNLVEGSPQGVVSTALAGRSRYDVENNQHRAIIWQNSSYTKDSI